MNLEYIENLVKEVKQNNEESKTLLVEEFKPLIKKIASSTFINSFNKEDIESECYAILFKCTKMYDLNKHRFVGYATNAIKNSIWDLIRRSKRREGAEGEGAYVMDDVLDNVLCDNTDIVDTLYQKFKHKKLHEAINSLPTDQKDFITYVFFENNSLTDYSKSKKISYNKVTYMKNKVLDYLYKHLYKYI